MRSVPLSSSKPPTNSSKRAPPIPSFSSSQRLWGASRSDLVSRSCRRLTGRARPRSTGLQRTFGIPIQR
jgi:hypothetical protein